MAIATTRTSETDSTAFLQAAFDSLMSEIAILDDEGTIVAVNAAWKAFATASGMPPERFAIGENYLRTCESARGDHCDEAQVVAAGIRAVMRRAQDCFDLEYPCHSPDEQRWFRVRVTRFDVDGCLRIVVSHDNVTRRRLGLLRPVERNAERPAEIRVDPSALPIRRSTNHRSMRRIAARRKRGVSQRRRLNRASLSVAGQ